MSKEFTYMKEGVAKDLVQYLMNDFQISTLDALDTLYDSETYAKLSNPSTGLYFQSSKYVYTFLQNELRTGAIG